MKKKITRRKFLKNTAVGSAYGLTALSGLGALSPRSAHAFSPNGRFLVVVNIDVDTLAMLQPLNTIFNQRRFGVRHEPDELLPGGVISQVGYQARQWQEDLPIFDTLFTGGELAVINRVGAPAPIYSRDAARQYFGKGYAANDPSVTTGWGQRYGQAAGFSSSKGVIDLTTGHPATQGGTYVPLRSRDIEEHEREFNQDNNDSRAREIANLSGAGYYSAQSDLAFKALVTNSEALNTVFDIRNITNAPGYGNGGPGPEILYRPGQVFQGIDSLLTSNDPISSAPLFRNSVEVIFAEIRGYGDIPDQRDRYNNDLDDLNAAINNFQSRMKAFDVSGTSLWDRMILILCPYMGRTIPSVGTPGNDPQNEDLGDFYSTAPGWATDYFIMGGAAINGAITVGAGYTGTDLAVRNHVTPNYNPAQVIHGAINAIGRSGDAVINLGGTPSLSTPFS